MAQPVEDRSLITGTYVKVRGESRLHKVVHAARRDRHGIIQENTGRGNPPKPRPHFLKRLSSSALFFLSPLKKRNF